MTHFRYKLNITIKNVWRLFPSFSNFPVQFLHMNSVEKCTFIKNVENKHFCKQKILEWPVGNHFIIYVEIKMTEDKLERPIDMKLIQKMGRWIIFWPNFWHCKHQILQWPKMYSMEYILFLLTIWDPEWDVLGLGPVKKSGIGPRVNPPRLNNTFWRVFLKSINYPRLVPQY